MGKRVVIGLVAGIVALGMKFYNKSADAKEVKSHLVSLCADDARCVKSVQDNFDACFESAYKLGGRRQAAHLESDQLVGCLNSRSGQSYFMARK
jgi:hypothetical protein